jgi:lipopolysaccharide export system permease protein
MFRLNIINWYVFRELLGPFLTSVLTFSAFMLMGRTLKLSDLVVNKGMGFVDILQLITYIYIPFLGYIIPISLLLAILLALGRLSADNEIIAMKSSGISLYQLVVPVGFFSSIVLLLTILLTFYANPWGFKALKDFTVKALQSLSEVGIPEKVFNDEFDGMLIYVDKTLGQGGGMKGIFIADKRDPAISTTIVAKEAYITSDADALSLNLRLYDGSIHRAGKVLESYQKGSFKTYDITLDLNASSIGELKYNEMSLTELEDSLRKIEPGNPEINEIKIEYHKKFSIPFACIIFGLLAIPLGIRKVRGGKSYGFIISLLVFLCYYLLLMFGESLGIDGRLPPLISMWLPNIIMAILGLYLFFHAARESSPLAVIWCNRLTTASVAYVKKTFSNS